MKLIQIALTLAALLLLYSNTSEAAFIDFNQTDKRMHAMGGCIIGLFTYEAASDLKAEHPRAASVVAGASVGILYEVYKSYHPDMYTPDVKDAIATAAGALVCVEVAHEIRVMLQPHGAAMQGRF